MQPVNLFDLASQQARWLAASQSAIAGNVANANTPGYKAMEAEPFAKVLDRTGVTLATTSASHIAIGGNGEARTVGTRERDDVVDLLPSGNSVVLETEMMKAGEIGRTFELNTAIVKAFHRMTLMVSRP